MLLQPRAGGISCVCVPCVRLFVLGLVCVCVFAWPYSAARLEKRRKERGRKEASTIRVCLCMHKYIDTQRHTPPECTPDLHHHHKTEIKGTDLATTAATDTHTPPLLPPARRTK
jgi:hypothetical protein